MRAQVSRLWRRFMVPGRLRGVLLPGVLLTVLGCSDARVRNFSSSAPSEKVTVVESSGSMALAASASAPGGSDKATAATEIPAAVARKIVYNARVTLVTDNVATLGEKLARLVKDAGGYISQTDQSSYTQAQRRATWTVRIPVERFDPFLAAISRLGELAEHHVDSQDVTQEYYDVEARISNKQQEEKRLLKHLADSTGKLEDILAVERELTRVRGEIEQMQGRIRYLRDVSALSTVTITATEIRDYTPPVAPTFATQIARTFRSSLDGLIDFSKSIILVVVAVVPWIPMLLILALLILWLTRRMRARISPVVLTRTGA
jgi:hypothetical protein